MKKDKQEIIDSIVQKYGTIDNIKQNPAIINNIFNEIKPEKLREFFKMLKMSEQDLKIFFQYKCTGILAELARVYEKNPTAIDRMNGLLLGKGIPLFKLQEYAADKNFQKKLLELSPFKYKLFEKISERNFAKTKRWNRLDVQTLNNLSDGYFEELLDDIFYEAKNGNKITNEELDVLANLFSAHVIKNKVFRDDKTMSNNVFNVTSKKELKYFEKIKETVCDIVINNPQLKEDGNMRKYAKYLQYFQNFEPLDRIKIAIIEKSFGMNLEDAIIIMKQFGNNIDYFNAINENNVAIIEQIKAISGILNCDNISKLQEIGNAVDFVKLDLNQGTLLFDEAKKVFEDELKKDLYSPKEEDFIEMYDGIKTYKAPLDFEAMTKFIGGRPSKTMWEKSHSNYQGKKNFRRKTCMSLTNGELLNPKYNGPITIGIGKTIKDFSFSGVFCTDVKSNMSTDPVEEDSILARYSDKENFICETTRRL